MAAAATGSVAERLPTSLARATRDLKEKLATTHPARTNALTTAGAATSGLTRIQAPNAFARKAMAAQIVRKSCALLTATTGVDVSMAFAIAMKALLGTHVKQNRAITIAMVVDRATAGFASVERASQSLSANIRNVRTIVVVMVNACGVPASATKNTLVSRVQSLRARPMI